MGKGSATTTNQTSSSADPQAAQSYRDLLARAQGVASTPYQAYTGELTAPVNAQQQLGVGNINTNANYAQPAVNQALGIAGAAANPLTQQQIQQYQNPYTQNVIDATNAQMVHDNGVAMAGLQGNQISQGALGGNATGVAKGILAGQNARTMASTDAALYDKGYTGAVSTAAQQFQQNPLAAGNAIANYGISGQGAALSGAGAQLGAGTLQQQTQQQADTANYGQYQQAQAYPYQQTQWLAGLDTGVGSNLGGSSAGSTTGPAPNQTAQYAGLGLAAAGMFLNRGGRVGYAEGGVVPHMADGGMPGTPWSGGVGWIPQMNIHGGAGAPHGSAPSLPTTPAFDPTKFASQLTSLGSKSGVGNAAGAFFNPEAYGASYTGVSGGGAYGGSSTSPLAGLSADDYGPGFRRGGVVGYAGGGAPGIDFTDQSWETPDVGPGIGPAGFADRFAPAGENPFGAMPKAQGMALAARSPVINPNDPVRMPDQTAVDAWRAGTPAVPAGGPPVQAKDEDDAELPANATPTQGGPQGRGVASAGFTPPYPVDVPSGVVPSKEPGFGLGLISPNAKTGLLTAGLSMLASRSPNLGNAIGEGGLAGFGAYGSAEERDRKVASEAQKLSTEAKKAANDLAQKTFTTNESARHNQATEANAAKDKIPVGYEQTKGGLRALPGGPADPAEVAKLTAAKAKPKGDLMDDETAQLLADRVRAGDTRALIGLGRGAQGAENISKIQGIVARDAASGKPVNDAARSILSNAASHAGLLTAERTQAAIMAKLSVYGRTAFNAADIVEKLSDAVPRTDFQPVNKIINAARTNTGDPKIVALGQGLMTLTNEYARAIGGGHGTVHDKEAAEQRLSAAQSKEQLRAVINVIRQEIVAAENAMPAARQHIRDIYNPAVAGPQGGGVAGGHAAPLLAPAAGSAPTVIAPAAIDMLKKNPALAPQFDQKYGAGASRQYLGQ